MAIPALSHLTPSGHADRTRLSSRATWLVMAGPSCLLICEVRIIISVLSTPFCCKRVIDSVYQSPLQMGPQLPNLEFIM